MRQNLQQNLRQDLSWSIKWRFYGASGLAALLLFVSGVSFAQQTTHLALSPELPKPKAAMTTMTTHASGSFEVKLAPQALGHAGEGAPLGRMLIDKQFHGDLEAVSVGEMLSAFTEVKGSAGYVAIERVNGALQGHTGSFVLQHSGTMNRGEPQLSVTVVPDSGTGGLVGLTGSMAINIVDGKHFYTFDYTLPDAPR